MPKVPKLGLLDYMHRTVTLSLFFVTLGGVYTLGEGAYNIIGKKYFARVPAAPQIVGPKP